MERETDNGKTGHRQKQSKEGRPHPELLAAILVVLLMGISLALIPVSLKPTMTQGSWAVILGIG